MKPLFLQIAIVMFVSGFVAVYSSYGQQNAEDTVRVNTYLLNMPVIATDKQGKFVSGLKKDDFTILQDGEPQPIEFFADEMAPMNVAILIDSSYSTSSVLDNIKKAARDFIKIFRPEDRGMIVTFDGEMHVIQDFTSDQKILNKAISKTEIGRIPGSNMQDAIYLLLKKNFAEMKGRKAIIVLTDGMTNGNLVSNQILLTHLAVSDVLVYPLIFKTNELDQFQSLSEKWKLPSGKVVYRDDLVKTYLDNYGRMQQFIGKMATQTGARVVLNKSKDFTESFQSIADELKHQYLIGYYPPNVEDGNPHNLVIKTSNPDIATRTKRNIILKLPN